MGLNNVLDTSAHPSDPVEYSGASIQRGDKTFFNTGAVRSADASKESYHLISPIILETLARVYNEGEAKYGAFNWEKGMPASDLLNHAMRHLTLFLKGDQTEDHLGHALWNLGAAIHSLQAWPTLNEVFQKALDYRRESLVK